MLGEGCLLGPAFRWARPPELPGLWLSILHLRGTSREEKVQGLRMARSHRQSNFNPDPNDSPQPGHFSFVLDLFRRKRHFPAQKVERTSIPPPCRGCNFMARQGLDNLMYVGRT